MSATASDRRIVHSLSLRILDKIEKNRNTIENIFMKEYQKKKFCGFYFRVLEIAFFFDFVSPFFFCQNDNRRKWPN